MSLSISNDSVAKAISEAFKTGNGAETPGADSAAKFQALMQQERVAPDRGGAHAANDKLVEAISHEDGQMEAALKEVAQFGQQSSSMAPTEAIAKASEVALNLSMVQFDFQAKMAVVTSSKSSAETLMKNQ
ncbi:type III secretion protein [Paraburkholderia strydomiana]|jgi:type III secretion inner rod protein HrpB2|uniref:type III secretion protein n=1 Tax=Paraburkholderia strydomiana TaxID=1245417 RepID=UPI001BE9F2F1|nr:type III secretion protein [Paraburkholderia strydomiana]MBT2793415.1 type III secretion protein [Paraburkholderia strydomiana]